MLREIGPSGSKPGSRLVARNFHRLRLGRWCSFFAGLAIITLLCGCVGPLVSVIKVDPDQARQLRATMKVYRRVDLPEGSYARLEPVGATSCKNKPWDIASEEDAVNQLLYKTSQLGGDGITDLICESEGTNLTKNCWSSVTCHASAVKVGAVADAGRNRSAVASYSSDVDKPGYALPENPNDFAVVIGVEKYTTLPAAEFADRDADAVRAHLLALGYPARNIYFLSGQQATRAKISQSVNTWLPNRVNDTSTVFFYYAGHGAPDPNTSQAYLVPVDGDNDDLGSTAYPLKELYAKLGALKARHVLVALDSCFSGAGGRSVLAKGARPLVTSVDLGASGLPNNVIALTASDKSEISGTIEDQGHGAFTYYMLKGLAGAAKNTSGTVTVQSLYDYLTPNVQDAARLHNRDQTPQLLQSGTAEAQTVLR